MNVAAYLNVNNAAGLFELTKDGEVLYSRFRQNNSLLNAGSELIGHNFFESVDGFENIKDFHQVFDNFVRSNQFTDNFVFDCRFPEKTVPLRVMLVRAFENSYPDKTDIIILDIRNSPY